MTSRLCAGEIDIVALTDVHRHHTSAQGGPDRRGTLFRERLVMESGLWSHGSPLP